MSCPGHFILILSLTPPNLPLVKGGRKGFILIIYYAICEVNFIDLGQVEVQALRHNPSTIDRFIDIIEIYRNHN